MHYSAVKVAVEGFTSIQADGSTLSLSDLTAMYLPTQLWEIEKINISVDKKSAWSVFWVAQDSSLSQLTKTTAILEKQGDEWKLIHAHSSQSISLDAAKASLKASQT